MCPHLLQQEALFSAPLRNRVHLSKNMAAKSPLVRDIRRDFVLWGKSLEGVGKFPVFWCLDLEFILHRNNIAECTRCSNSERSQVSEQASHIVREISNKTVSDVLSLMQLCPFG